MKLRLLLLLLLLLPVRLFAQTGAVTGVALDNVGNTVAGATITVCPQGSSGIPCSPVTASTTSNGQGAFSVTVPVGTYTVTVFRTGIISTSSTVVVAPSNITVANNVTYTGKVVFTGIANINNTIFVSQQCGGSTDLGVCINNAVTACSHIPCFLRVDAFSPSTLSTTPNIPAGTYLEWDAAPTSSPFTWTLATRLLLGHHGTGILGNGAEFNCTADVGDGCIVIGKSIQSTANTQNAATGGCTANCVTWVSGTQFTNYDPGDQISITGVGNFNISSVQSATVLSLAAAPGTNTSVTSAGFMYTVNAFNFGPFNLAPVVKDLTINNTGAQTNANDAEMIVEFVNGVQVDHIKLTGSQHGLWLKGTLNGRLDVITMNGNKNQLWFDATSFGVNPSASNIVRSIGVFVSAPGGNPILFTGGANGAAAAAFNNIILGGDSEGNAATVMGTFTAGAHGNTIIGLDHERNGDGTTSSADWACNGTNGNSYNNVFKANRFTSAAANTPAAGILATSGCFNLTLEQNDWTNGTNYTTAWSFTGTASGELVGNIDNGVAHTDPVGFVVNAFGGFGKSTQTGAAVDDPPAIGNANCLRSAAAANNTTYCLISGSGANAVLVDPGGQGTLLPFVAQLRPNAAGTVDAGTTALPFANIWFGTAATNNFKLQPAATAAARTVSVPDPGTNVNLAFNLSATSSAFATATTAGTCVQNTTAVAGAATTMVAEASPVSTPGVGAVWSAFVSSAGNVTINECAVATSAGGSIAFNIRVHP